MPRISIGAKAALHGQLKLARLMRMRDEEFAGLCERLRRDPLFEKLTASGAVRVSPMSRAAFTARSCAGWDLRAPAQGLGDLLDAGSPMVALIRRIGVGRFQASFLSGDRISDRVRASRCKITAGEAAALREFLDKVYIRSEFEATAPVPPGPPRKVFSTVAGFTVQKGRPVLRWFDREVWKARYAVDEDRLEALLRGLAPSERETARRFAARLAFVERRKTTLFKVLEALQVAQAAYLTSGKPELRQPVTQRSIATAVNSDPSVLNRLISNKSVELPWGMEAPLKELMPSAKKLTRDVVEGLALAEPGLSDEALRRVLAERRNIHLSRRSIAQYRKESGLGARGKR